MSAVARVPTATIGTKIIPGTRSTKQQQDLHGSSRNGFCTTPQSAHVSTLGLLAYGLPNGSGDVIVVCTNSVQIVQTLSGHRNPITSVLWFPPHVSQHHHHGNKLFTADAKGFIALWDVAEGVMERSVCVPGNRAVQCLALTSNRQLLVVVTVDHASFVFDAMLLDPEPIPGMRLPCAPTVAPPSSSTTDTPTNIASLPFPPSRLVFSNLDSHGSAALALGDRVRIIKSVDTAVSGAAVSSSSSLSSSGVKDIIFDSGEDDEETVVDVCFSDAVPEVMFIASRHLISMYDWKLHLMLKEPLIWAKPNISFVSLYPVGCHTMEEDGRLLPHVYSLTSDCRLSAWYVTGMETFQSVSTDCRGVRIPSKTLWLVVQSSAFTNEFAAIFADGSVAFWTFLTDERCWSMHGYLDVPNVKPLAVCTLSYSELFEAEKREGGEITGAVEEGGLDDPNINTVTPSASRVVDHTIIIAGLENGDITVQSALFNEPLRRYTVVHTGTTKLLMMTPYMDDLFWIATCRTVASSQRHFLQVSLLSARSGVLQFVLRDPPPIPEVSALSSMTMDSSRSFLLLSFSSGAFEVWNVKRRSLLHVHHGSNVSRVAWSVSATRLDANYGPYQTIVAIMEEGGTQSFRVGDDRIVRLKETIPVRVTAGNSGVSHVCAVGMDDLVCADWSSGVSVVKGVSTSTKWASLSQVPKNAVPYALAPFVMNREGLSYVAIAFDDGSFGVWDVKTLKRVGYSGKDLRVVTDYPSTPIAWVSSNLLLVMCQSGSLLIVNKECDTVNSSSMSRCLRHPIESIAFLKPSHAMYMCAQWEMAPLLGESSVGTVAAPLTEAAAMSVDNSASYLVQNVAQRRPCRGPFGQIISDEIRTLVDELELYTRTMLPHKLRKRLHIAVQKRSIESSAFVVAQLCGQREKQHFWVLVQSCRHTWQQHADTALEFSKSHAIDDDTADQSLGDTSDMLAGTSHDILSEQSTQIAFGPFHPVLLADRFSEALTPVEVLTLNRQSLTNLRRHALNSFRSRNVDDASARLTISRELLSVGDHASACELLIDSNSELDSFAAHATLAIAVAAAMQPTSLLPPPLVLTAKRAAAMLLAKGDVDGAAEKFSLIGEHYEAALALQSRGVWNTAAMLARLSPMSSSCRNELLHRWAAFAAQRGQALTAARLLLTLQSPRQALVLLADCDHYTDVAGLFAMVMSIEYSLLSELSLSMQVASPFRPQEKAGSFSETLRDMLVSLLADYSSHLESVGNVFCQRLVASMMETFDTSSSSATASTMMKGRSASVEQDESVRVKAATT